jgi:hypothetical protein
MSFSKIAVEQREQETALLKRFMRFSVPGAISFNLLIAAAISAFWHSPPPVAETETEIEVIAEDATGRRTSDCIL